MVLLYRWPIPVGRRGDFTRSNDFYLLSLSLEGSGPFVRILFTWQLGSNPKSQSRMELSYTVSVRQNSTEKSTCKLSERDNILPATLRFSLSKLFFCDPWFVLGKTNIYNKLNTNKEWRRWWLTKDIKTYCCTINVEICIPSNAHKKTLTALYFLTLCQELLILGKIVRKNMWKLKALTDHLGRG